MSWELLIESSWWNRGLSLEEQGAAHYFAVPYATHGVEFVRWSVWQALLRSIGVTAERGGFSSYGGEGFAVLFCVAVGAAWVRIPRSCKLLSSWRKGGDSPPTEEKDSQCYFASPSAPHGFESPAAANCYLVGGKGGIRTPGTVTRTLDFESSAFNHSATFPNTITARNLGVFIVSVKYITPTRKKLSNN